MELFLTPRHTMSTLFSAHPNATMAKQSVDSLPGPEAVEVDKLCCYHNRTAQIQIIRMAAPTEQLSHQQPREQLERVVFPGQRLMFYAPTWAQLKVYASQPVGALLADTISCDRLRVITPE